MAEIKNVKLNGKKYSIQPTVELNIDVTQETGDSEELVMSQKATTEAIEKHISDGKNKLDPSNVVNAYLQISTGNLLYGYSDITYSSDEMIEIPNGSVKAIFSWMGATIQAAVTCNKVAFYDEEKAFLSIVQSPTKIVNIPENAKYMRFECSAGVYQTSVADGKAMLEFTNDSTATTWSAFEPYGFVFNGRITEYDEKFVEVDEKFVEVDEKFVEVVEATKNLPILHDYTDVPLEQGTISTDNGTNVNSVDTNAINIRTVSLIEIKKANAPLIVRVASGYNINIFFYDEDQSFLVCKYNITSDIVLPEGAKYIRYRIQNSNGISIEDISNIEIYQYNEIGVLQNSKNIRWCAMGDSITEGWYSSEEGSCALNVIKGWASVANEVLNFTLKNNAIGGTGYVQEKEGNSNNARHLADTLDFSNYDLVTLAFGVNDWKYNKVLGTFEDDIQTGGTLYSNMRYVIEKILADNPVCKIIVITPLNCSVGGSEATNWGVGHSFSNNGTLEDIFNAEKTVCEYYGIEYIDMTHFSTINRKNIKSLLLDNVHPSIKAHRILGHELAKKINFK